jgi:hypothetical protein
MKIPYQLITSEPYPLPICDVFLLGPAGRVLVRAVLDSGAVRPIFPRKAAENAGIKLPSIPDHYIQYGGGPIGSVLVRSHLSLGELRWDADVSFVERLELPYALLGRRGVFSQFNEVKFLEKTAPSRIELVW